MTQQSTQTLPLLPLRRGVVLPGTVTTIPVGRKRSRALVEQLAAGDRFLLGVQFDAEVEAPAIADLHPLAVVATVKDKRLQGKREAVILVEALERVRLTAVHLTDERLSGTFEPVGEIHEDTDAAKALAESLRGLVGEVTDDATVKGVLASSPPGTLADRIASLIELAHEKKAEVLHALDVEARLRLVAEAFHEVRAKAELQEKIDSEVRKSLGKTQREALLRQQLRAIRQELGEGDDGGDDDGDKLKKRVAEADLPDEVRKVAERELRRLGNAQGPEGNVIRTYLEWIVDLPWKVRAPSNQDIDAMARRMDADHYGLEEVKRRILEHMAVLKLAGSKSKGTILCLAGPPGVGKTSLAQSVADATGRPLGRVSLGGIRDEAEVRGHRRTYVGALPGRIIHALRKVGAKNPVIVLDEIDKLGRGWQGDPEAALLEVLDPQQNNSFTDHYMELPFDLSEVLFIATANDLSTLSPPLRDRLEIIEVSGYTLEEKVRIARDHLWPDQLEEHGLAEGSEIGDPALRLVIAEYTREAGVRQLARELAKVCRSLALDIARGDGSQPALDLGEARLRKILGKPRFFDEPAERERPAGVAAGLAWTPVGGDVLYVETTHMPGKGKLEITGQLGDVMNESARAALAYLRSHAGELGIDDAFLEHHDLHIHVPAGGVPKDGPSAGVTIFTALASLLSGRRVRPDTAMTGEATLRGRVLPVGGIKSKVLAAHRAGFTRIVLPHKNERDLDDIPEAVRKELEIILATEMRDVLRAALEEEGASSTAVPLPRSSRVVGADGAAA
jgi:ATP-dependent Lon protease